MQTPSEPKLAIRQDRAHVFFQPAVDISDAAVSSFGTVADRDPMRLFLKKVCSRARSFSKAEDGQALVELAICLPMLLFIVMGICAFGIAINNYISLTSATSSGTRALSVSRGNTSDPCQTLSSTVSSAAPLLTSASLSYSLTLTPYGGTAATYTGTSCAGAISNLSASATAKVTVTYPCTLVVMNQNFAVNCKLTAVDAELVQ